MSQINVDIVAPQSGTSVEVSGVEITSPISTPPATFLGQNIAIGKDALSSVTTGGGLIAIGQEALKNCNLTNELLGRNIAIGNKSLIDNTFGDFNIAIGQEAMSKNISGQTNIAIGEGALSSNPPSSPSFNDSNIAIGYHSLRKCVQGAVNVAIGHNSGFSIENGIQNVFLGNGTGSLTTNGNNNVCLGFDVKTATPTSSNSITLGNSSISVIRAAVTTITSLSDERDKKEIQDLPLGLEFVEKLKPVKFVWNDRDESGKHDVEDFGFIAQDLKAAQEESEASYLNLVYDENPEKLEASYGKLLPVLVKAIQEMNSEIKSLKEEILTLKSK